MGEPNPRITRCCCWLYRILLHIRHQNTLECGLPVLSQTRSALISFSPPLGPGSLAIFISLYPVLLTPPESSRVLHLPLFLLKRLYFRTSQEDLIKAGANLAVRAPSHASRVLIELLPGYWLFVIAIWAAAAQWLEWSLVSGAAQLLNPAVISSGRGQIQSQSCPSGCGNTGHENRKGNLQNRCCGLIL